MEGKKIPEYLNINEITQINNQPISIYTFANQQEKHNPEYLDQSHINSLDIPHQIQPQSPQTYMHQAEKYRQKLNRSKDECKTYESSPHHKHSNSLTFTPKGLSTKLKTFKNFSDQQDSENNYRDLTLKLETALNKISVSGKKLNKSSSQSNDIWRRSQLCAERKKKQIQKKRQEIEAQKLKQLKDKPAINKYSEKIAKQTGHEPIYVRFQKIVERKKKKLEQTEQIKKKEKQQQENLFLQELNRCMKKSSNISSRTHEQYFNEMMRWKEKKQERNKQKLEEQKKKEIQSLTFKPNLNNNSKKIAAEKKRLPIDQRGLIKKKVNLEYSFTPKLSNKLGK